MFWKKHKGLSRTAALILGSAVVFVLLEASLRVPGFVVSLRERLFPLKVGASEFPILVIGDSISALGGEHSYPSQLERILNQRRPGVHFRVVNRAIPSVSTDVIVRGVEDSLQKYGAKMIVSMMGVTDVKASSERDSGADSHGYSIWSKLRTVRFIGNLLESVKRERSHRASKPAYVLRFEQGDFEAARSELETELRINPKNVGAYLYLGAVHRNLGNYDLSPALYRKIIEIAPGNQRAYVELARYYRSMGRLAEAQRVLEEQCEKNPGSGAALLDLGTFHKERGDHSSAERAFKSALELPGSERAWNELARSYSERKLEGRAKDALLRSLRVKPTGRAHFELGRLYRRAGKAELAEKEFQAALKLGTEGWNFSGPSAEYYAAGPEVVAFELASLLIEKGRYDEAAEVLKKVELRETTLRNYSKIGALSDSREIPWIAVGYPNRSAKFVELLVARAKLARVVDLEAVFRDAIANEGYSKLFIDVHGGDFGHGTALGNRMIAEAIADTILKVHEGL